MIAGLPPDAAGDVGQQLDKNLWPARMSVCDEALQAALGGGVGEGMHDDVPPVLSEAARIGYTRIASHVVAARSAPLPDGGAGGLLLRRLWLSALRRGATGHYRWRPYVP